MIQRLGLLAAFVAYTTALITRGDGLKNSVVMDQDVHVYYLDEVFNVTKAKGPISFTTNVGHIRTYQTPLEVETFKDTEFAKVEAVEFIDNQTFAAVLDNSHMYIQTVSLEGNHFTHILQFTYFRFGPTIRCDDIEVFQPTQKIYVACWGMTDPDQDAGLITILEINLRDSTDYRIINLNQTEENRVQFRMRIGLHNLTQPSGIA